MSTKKNMKKLLIFEFVKYYTFRKSLFSTLVAIGICLLVMFLMTIKVGNVETKSDVEKYFWNVEAYLFLFWLFINLMFPFILFQYLYFDRVFIKLQFYNYIPQNLFRFFASKVIFFAILLILFSILFAVFFILKLYLFNLERFTFSYNLLIFKWVFLVTFISFFYYLILLFIFFTTKLLLAPLLFHIFNILLFSKDSFYWLPINWAKLGIDYSGNFENKMLFFKEHPPWNFAVFILFQLIMMVIISKFLYKNGRRI